MITAGLVHPAVESATESLLRAVERITAVVVDERISARSKVILQHIIIRMMCAVIFLDPRVPQPLQLVDTVEVIESMVTEAIDEACTAAADAVWFVVP